MKNTQISDRSMMDIDWYDFKNASVFDDGSLMITHIDKHEDFDNSSIIIFDPEEVKKLKEILNA